MQSVTMYENIKEDLKGKMHFINNNEITAAHYNKFSCELLSLYCMIPSLSAKRIITDDEFEELIKELEKVMNVLKDKKGE